MNKSIAFFDFDGTLTYKDSFIAFIKYYKGSSKLFLGFLVNSPFLIAMKLGWLPHQKAKEKILSYFFKGENEIAFNSKCEEFCNNILPTLIRPDAWKALTAHEAQNEVVCIVTASPENWVRPYFKPLSINVIGTKLEVVNKKITGKITGKNCKGIEKVNRIKQVYQLQHYQNIYAYGDSSGDKQLLDLATHQYYKHFTQ